MKRTTSHACGSTLILALWALVLISAVLFAWVKLVDQGIESSRVANRGLEARALAHSGLAVASHGGVNRNSPHLHAAFGQDRSYHVTMESEGSRLNLNYMLAGADPARIQFLKRYLAQRGMTLQQREVFIDCLLDWTSPAKGVRRLNSVPEGPDYQLPHRPLQSLDEIPLIHGSQPLVSRPHWKDDFTLFSSGPFDLEGVSAQTLALVPGIGDQRAQQFVKTREERELSGVNKDGYPFKNRAEALSFLGFTEQQFSQMSGFLGFRDPVLRVRSVGESGKVIRQVEVIMRRVEGAKAQVLKWSEE